MIEQDIHEFLKMRREQGLTEIFMGGKGSDKGKQIIKGFFDRWASSSESSTIMMKAVTSRLVFGYGGLLSSIGEIANADSKLCVLLLNPYSTNAIIRSVLEGRTFERPSRDQLRDYTIEKHEKRQLCLDFLQAINHLKHLNTTEKFNGCIECRIYSSAPPSFILIDTNNALVEHLVLGNTEEKQKDILYGTLPHLHYQAGPARDGLASHFDYVWKLDAIPLADFHEEIEREYYEINRLPLLYNLQQDIWDKQWESDARSRNPDELNLYQKFRDSVLPLPRDSKNKQSVLDLGCGMGEGGSLDILSDHPEGDFDFVDLSKVAIDKLKAIVDRYSDGSTAMNGSHCVNGVDGLDQGTNHPNSPESESYNCFLSHNTRDKPAVRALATELRARGISIWLDDEQLPPGIPWQPLLESGIRASHSVAVLVGADGLGPWEMQEMHAALSLAVNDRRPVIPVLLANAPVKPELPLLLHGRTWVDLRQSADSGNLTPLDQLIWGITGGRPDGLDVQCSRKAWSTSVPPRQSGRASPQEAAPRASLDQRQLEYHSMDMLSFLKQPNDRRFSLIFANFSVIYLTQIKAIETYRWIFRALKSGGILLASVWTRKYFDMRVHEERLPGYRPPYEFRPVPLAEDLRIIIGGPGNRHGEIRRFYRDGSELRRELELADEGRCMDFDNLVVEETQNGAVLCLMIRRR
jgi:SAM-dependent methyltransferase